MTAVATAAVRPRPVFCVTAHERRDRAVAEAVCSGRFTHAGVTRELGVEPDWLGADLPADEEWRIEWSKFYYGLDLASAFVDSGERRFLTSWERLVGSWISQVQVASDSSDVTARRIQNWIYAWRGFCDAPSFSGLREGLDGALLDSIAAQARYVREELTPERNHRTLELYALFIVALALPQLDRDGKLLELAVAELHDNLLRDFRADGVHRESSTHYHLIALRSFVGARENARRFGVELPDGFDAALGRAFDFALHCQRPDGAIPVLSDGDAGSYPELLALGADLLDRDELRYAASRGRQGSAPRRRLVSFPAGGYFVQRSGWGDAGIPFDRERFLIFDCGPLGDGGHGHYDLLSVEAFGAGRPLLVDPGRYTYAEGSPNWRRWFRGTAAHNTVCVDRLDQTPYTRGRPNGRVAEGHLLGRFTSADIDVLAGEARSPVYEAIHTRRVVFVVDRYWVIEDRLVGERPHRYGLRWHLAPEAAGATQIDGETGVVLAPGLALAILTHGPVRLERGWVSPRYGVKQAAPVVSADVAGRSAVRFVTVVVPLEAGDRVPAIAAGERADDPFAPASIEVARHGGRDVFELSPAPSGPQLGVAWEGERP